MPVASRPLDPWCPRPLGVAATSVRRVAIAVALVSTVAACGGLPPPPDARGDAAQGARDGAVDDASAPDAPRVPPVVSFWIDGAAGPRPVAALRYGEPFTVRATGLPVHAHVTLHTYLRGYHGRASFIAHRAEIDTARDPALEGTYTGLDPDGLLWSMVRESDAGDDTLDVRAALEFEGAVVAEATLHRPSLTEGLRAREVADEGLVGVLYAPDDGAAHPAVLVLGGSEGGLGAARFRAAYLASRGFTALGLAYFGAGALPGTLARIPLEYFGTALAWLARQPEVDGARLAVMGTSRGGELALQLGAMYPQLAAVVAEVPSHVRWPGLDSAASSPPSWTVRGEALATVPAASASAAATEALPSGETGYRMAPVFRASLERAAPEVVTAATIAVQDTHGPVLMIGAADDGVWPSCAFVEAAIERLRATGHATAHPDQGLCLAEAGHLIGPPGAPTTDLYAVENPVLGVWTVLGGTPAGTARAQREATARVLDFLATALR